MSFSNFKGIWKIIHISFINELLFGTFSIKNWWNIFLFLFFFSWKKKRERKHSRRWILRKIVLLWKFSEFCRFGLKKFQTKERRVWKQKIPSLFSELQYSLIWISILKKKKFMISNNKNFQNSSEVIKLHVRIRMNNGSIYNYISNWWRVIRC